MKPNRLAIQMLFPNDKIIGTGVSLKPVEVKTKWLNGAPTSNQKAITEVRLYHADAGFSEFPDYRFSDKSGISNLRQKPYSTGKPTSREIFHSA